MIKLLKTSFEQNSQMFEENKNNHHCISYRKVEYPITGGYWHRVQYSKKLVDDILRMEVICFAHTKEITTTLLPAPLFGRQEGTFYIPKETKEIYLRIYSMQREFDLTIERIEIISAFSIFKKGFKRDRWNFSLAIGALLIRARKEFQQAIRFACSGMPTQEVDQWIKKKRIGYTEPNAVFDDTEENKTKTGIEAVELKENEIVQCNSYINRDYFRQLILKKYEQPLNYYIFTNNSVIGLIKDADKIIIRYLNEYPDVDIFVPAEAIKQYEDGTTTVDPFPIRLSRFNLQQFPEEFNCIILTQRGYEKLLHALQISREDNFDEIIKYIIPQIQKGVTIVTIMSPILIYNNKKYDMNKEVENRYQLMIAKKARQLSKKQNQKSFSVIIPTRDNFKLLRACIESLNRYEKNLKEIIIVDNGSRKSTIDKYSILMSKNSKITILKKPGPFNFSFLCNVGARNAGGDIVIFLNDDTELLENESLMRLSQWFDNPSLGIVGPCLLFPSRKIQHIGIVIGMGGIADHVLHGVELENSQYQKIFTRSREVSAITGACLAVRKRDFERIGGFDETNLPVECNDVDLCLRMREQGLAVIIDPNIKLIHRQSASRGFSWKPFSRYSIERSYFQKKWKKEILNDPMFHPVYSLFSTTPMLDD
jgi:GT2 family glycosyltransferase